jgi:hypothetical protein
MNENELADKITEWYWANKNKINSNKRFWGRNPVGCTIASIAKEQKRWKNAPRGKRHKEFPTLRATNEIDLDF